jgi:hypothetical protein
MAGRKWELIDTGADNTTLTATRRVASDQRSIMASPDLDARSATQPTTVIAVSRKPNAAEREHHG